MKRWGCVALLVPLLALLLCVGAGAEQEGTQYSALPEQYTALEELIPAQLAGVLPEGLFSSDVGEVRVALGQLLSFSGLLGEVLELYGLQLGKSGALLASVCGLLLLCGLTRALGKAQNVPHASLAPRLCLFGAVAAGLAQGPILVTLKQNGWVKHLTLVVATACMLAFVIAIFLPKHIKQQGKQDGKH